jgi:hypothetical protein
LYLNAFFIIKNRQFTERKRERRRERRERERERERIIQTEKELQKSRTKQYLTK